MSYIYNTDAIREIHTKNGEFFTFLLEDGFPPIIDYIYLEREIIISESLKLGGEKNKESINSIGDLRIILEELVLDAKNSLYTNALLTFGTTPFNEEILDNAFKEILHNFPNITNEEMDSFHFKEILEKYYNIKSEELTLLINQLIVDILYNKYCKDTEMKLSEYCKNHYYFSYRGRWSKIESLKVALDKYDHVPYTEEAARKVMERQIEDYVEMMSKPANEEELIKRGLELESYTEYTRKKGEKKPKWIWDLIYYNCTLPAYKQYRRDFWRDSEEDYRKFADEINCYDKFVEDIFTLKDENDKDYNKDYFYKTMDFYYLESISKLEFIYKLSERLEKEGIDDINNYDFLARQEFSEVSCPRIIEIDGSEHLIFTRRRNYYNSFPLMQESWLHRLDYKINDAENNPFFESLINFIRIATYELFQYHYEFKSNNYEEIVAFLKEDYNLLEKYIVKTKIMRNIKEKEPLSPEQKTRIKSMQIISDLTFKKVTKKVILDVIKCGNKETSYEKLLGMDKEAFEKIYGILISEHIKIHANGGRKSNLSVHEKLVATIEYERYNRTMENIAYDYGTEAAQISKARKWVIDTLRKTLESDDN